MHWLNEHDFNYYMTWICNKITVLCCVCVVLLSSHLHLCNKTAMTGSLWIDSATFHIGCVFPHAKKKKKWLEWKFLTEMKVGYRHQSWLKWKFVTEMNGHWNQGWWPIWIMTEIKFNNWNDQWLKWCRWLKWKSVTERWKFVTEMKGDWNKSSLSVLF